MSASVETVMLKVIGPGKIVKQPVVARARLEQTWRQFLEGPCHLKIVQAQGILVRTNLPASMTKANGESYGYGWTAELDDKIEDFLSKYDRKRRQYTVRLIQRDRNSGSAGGRRRSIPPSEVATSSSGSGGAPPENGAGRVTGQDEDDDGSDDSEATLVASEGDPLEGDGGIQEEVEVIDLELEEEDDDLEVEVIDYDLELEELEDDLELEVIDADLEDDRSEPSTIQVDENDELKARVLQNVGRFSNNFMLRMRKEFQDLVATGQWNRNAMRSPLSSYLIQDLFRTT